MLRNSFSAILILTFGIACVGNAAPLQDDINTFALWHCDTIVGVNSPDDTSVSGRAAHQLVLATSGSNPVTVSAAANGPAGEGQSGQLDFGTDGRQIGTVATAWPLSSVPGAPGSEIKIDGWFYIPSYASLPIPITAGGTGANGSTMYQVQVSNTTGGGSIAYIAVVASTSGNYGIANMNFQNQNLGTLQSLPIYRYNKVTGAALTDANAINLTGKWLHVVAYSQYASPEPAWDPNYNRLVFTITDSSTATTYQKYYSSTNKILNGSGTGVYIGHVPGRTGSQYTPYRGWRGKIDELKIKTLVHDPMVAYGPTPSSGATVGVSANMPVTWIKATPYNPADTVYQDVYFSTKSTFSKTDPNWTKVASGITTNTANVGSVEFGKTYYWVVDSNDSGTKTYTQSAVWNFNVNDIAPTVNAGSDVATYLVSGSRVLTFTSTVTDPDTDASLLTYQWAQIAGPTATISSPTSKDTNVTLTQVGSYYFQLTANDGTFPGSDIVRVQVYSTACAASMSLPSYSGLQTDFNSDCRINFLDFAQIAANWQKCNSVDPACSL